MSCAKVRRELERYGLLLLQDKRLPSIATIIAGEPMSKSWWSHPNSNEMFRCLQNIEEDVLVTRLIAGKVTYVHKRLWPALAASGTSVVHEFHTESGRHERRVESSRVWSKRLQVRPLASRARGRAEIESATAAAGAPLSLLPWHR